MVKYRMGPITDSASTTIPHKSWFCPAAAQMLWGVRSTSMIVQIRR